jgi:phosphohistidine phosphatase
MELILWRHAEAADGAADLARPLTGRGHAQAERMAAWLGPRLAPELRILVSPALRAQQTARALGRAFQTLDELAPGAGVSDHLQAAGWPDATRPAMLVGHQPTLGETASLLLHGRATSMRVGKGSVLWLRGRERRGRTETVLMLAIEPEMLR